MTTVIKLEPHTPEGQAVVKLAEFDAWMYAMPQVGHDFIADRVQDAIWPFIDRWHKLLESKFPQLAKLMEEQDTDWRYATEDNGDDFKVVQMVVYSYCLDSETRPGLRDQCHDRMILQVRVPMPTPGEFGG